ncbi:hypothetical protein DLAC_07386 [Tieghemostelium lacteum]|uniref:Transmembrane protein n=1 Tax=Tieghemostelium lacteum TaxID=361077 RepID=A0A151ZCE2_TIELA|nr:hypothetical protein DLAC_07386 [Tieghemostelium lacteum]|eukprot:KYQ91617.1 hypothetical protein DLAC_07386 [Tieghemostelium lacteum]
MNSLFSTDFKQYLLKCQPSVKRITLMVLISTFLISYGEYTLFVQDDQIRATGCSVPLPGGDYSDSTLRNCFEAGLFKCIQSTYSTSSNETLAFQVPFLGTPDDKVSRATGTLCILFFINFMISFQVSSVLGYLKKKRIQDILADSGVFLKGNLQNENRNLMYVMGSGICYLIIKLVYLRNKIVYYGKLECNGDLMYELELTLTMGSIVGTLITSGLFAIFLPLSLVGNYINYLSDLDFKNLMYTFTSDNFIQFTKLQEFDLNLFKLLFSDYVNQKYRYSTYLEKVKRRNIFHCTTTSTGEISEFLLDLQSKNTHILVFKPMTSLQSNTYTINNQEGANESLLVLKELK